MRAGDSERNEPATRGDGVEVAPRYDEAYFARCLGEPYFWHNPFWHGFFGRIADAIVAELAPSTVLDAGCAIGFLVDALRERGVEAWGIDISEYAIEQVPERIRDYCSVGSVTDELARDYDLIVCIEVLEHLPAENADRAIANFARHTDSVLFSSTPEDFREATHFTVRPTDYWAGQFARHGFFRNVDLDAGFVTPHAIHFLRAGQTPVAIARAYERWHWQSRKEIHARREASLAAEQETAELLRQLEGARAELGEVQVRLADAERMRAEHAERMAGLERKLAEESRSRAESERERAAEARRLAETEQELARRRAEVQQIAAERDAAQRYVNLMQETVSWRITAPLRSVRRTLRRSGNHGSASAAADAPPTPEIALPTSPAPTRDAIKAVLFVTLGGPVARRYRADHQSEELELSGVTTDVVEHGEIDLDEALERYEAFILHRVPFGPDIDRFVRRARSLAKPVIFDTDDLVFDPAVIRYVAALDTLEPDERDLFVEGVHRYRETLVRCGAVVASTEPLAEHVRRFHQRVVVAPNAASVAMVERADELLASRRERETPADTVTLAYLSGTATHDRDFREATDAVLQVLEKRPHTRFLAVGPLTLDSRFESFPGRVERLPLQPWERLPDLIMKIDINLAPLERENPFTEAKSCIKYIEAGLLEVPTVASPRADFVRAIEDGRNGLLADEPTEWEQSITHLVDDVELRRSVGREAATDIRRHHTVKAVARRYHRTIADLVSAGGQAEPLRINWVMYPPFARAGGGERNIFRIQEQLARSGHRQHVYINPIAHFGDFSRDDAVDFLEEAFGPLNAEVTLGYDDIRTSDVTIATFWPTAYVVAEHDKSLFKAYFVQDYERDFYESDDPRRSEAEGTYRLPLRHICLGRHLASLLTSASGLRADFVDFALDEVFQLRRPPEKRSGRTRVLFYARPSLPRRGYALGLEALRRAKEARPETEVLFFGSNAEDLGDVPFEFQNLGTLDPEGVARAMNDAHVALSLSFTNISNVPFEAMACGCAVVDVDLPNVSSMVSRDACVLAKPSPDELASALVGLVDDPSRRAELGRRAASEMQGRRWERTGAQFEQALLDLCFARIRDGRGTARRAVAADARLA